MFVQGGKEINIHRGWGKNNGEEIKNIWGLGNKRYIGFVFREQSERQANNRCNCYKQYCIMHPSSTQIDILLLYSARYRVQIRSYLKATAPMPSPYFSLSFFTGLKSNPIPAKSWIRSIVR